MGWIGGSERAVGAEWAIDKVISGLAFPSVDSNASLNPLLCFHPKQITFTFTFCPPVPPSLPPLLPPSFPPFPLSHLLGFVYQSLGSFRNSI